MINLNNDEKKSFKRLINNRISSEINPDEIAKLELVREFYTNDNFRQCLKDYLWNNRKAQ